MNDEYRGSVAANRKAAAGDIGPRNQKNAATRPARRSKPSDQPLDNHGRATGLFKDAEKHYVAITRIIDQLSAIAPYHEREGIQWALTISHDNFKKWVSFYRNNPSLYGNQ